MKLDYKEYLNFMNKIFNEKSLNNFKLNFLFCCYQNAAYF